MVIMFSEMTRYKLYRFSTSLRRTVPNQTEWNCTSCEQVLLHKLDFGREMEGLDPIIFFDLRKLRDFFQSRYYIGTISGPVVYRHTMCTSGIFTLQVTCVTPGRLKTPNKLNWVSIIAIYGIHGRDHEQDVQWTVASPVSSPG